MGAPVVFKGMSLEQVDAHPSTKGVPHHFRPVKVRHSLLLLFTGIKTRLSVPTPQATCVSIVA